MADISAITYFIPASAIIGIVFAVIQYVAVSKVTVGIPAGDGSYVAVEDGVGDSEVIQSVAEIQGAISEGIT